MKITVIGCGRWGTFIAWYLDKIGHSVSLYGRKSSAHMQKLIETRTNGLVELPETLHLTNSLDTVKDSDVIVISVNSQPEFIPPLTRQQRRKMERESKKKK